MKLQGMKKRKQSGRQSKWTAPWSASSLEPRLMLAGDVTPAMVAPPLDASPSTTQSATQSASSPGIVFVAGDVPQIDSVLANVGSQHDLVLLSPNVPLVDQISEALQGRTGVSSIHLVTHGESGRLALGDQQVDRTTLANNASEIRNWQTHLSNTADILIYGCKVGSGSSGQAFVSLLSKLSGADVAASTNVTGNLQRGDWILERQLGTIETKLAFAESFRAQYRGTLPISIRAAGVTNQEQMLLQIDGATVATFNNVGGDAYAGVFETYTANIDGIDPGQVRLVFTNDLIDPIEGDRNLRIDNITIDGVVYETENPSVFSTGTWLPSDGVVPGFRQNEYLHTDGYFQYAAIPQGGDGSIINVVARGSEGDENLQLQIDGVTVQTWTAIGTANQVFSFQAADTINAGQVRVAFTNDLWNPSAGIDRNLIVDSIEVDGQVYQTEAADVFSTGTWLPSDGVQPGFRQSEILHTNGYFQYADTPSGNGSQISVTASGFEGDESMSLQIDGQTVASWNSIGLTPANYGYTANETITADRVRVTFNNDRFGNGIDRNLRVDKISIDGVDFQTESPTVFSTGTWLPGDGIQPGYRQSEILHANGFFQYDADPGEISVTAAVESVSENENSVQIELVRAGNVGTVGVTYATTAETATPGEDYVSATGTVSFADGQTSASITLDLLPDALFEGDESLILVLSDPTGGARLGLASTRINIIDDDQPPSPGVLSVSPPIAVATEADSAVSFVITRSGGSDGAVTVVFDTIDGEAIAGEDYQATSTLVSFADGELSKTVNVAIISDDVDEPTESFTVALSAPTGGASIDQASAIGILSDDDPAKLGGSPVFQYNGHLYLLTPSSSSWSDAQTAAEAVGGNLVTINDVAEETWLQTTFGTTSPYWIGLRDPAGTDLFQWVSGQPATYTNWATDNPGDPGNDFVTMNDGGELKWTNVGSAETHFGIIEIGNPLADGPTIPNGSGFTTETIAQGLNQPVAFAAAPDGRIFVVEKAGVIRVIENGQLLATPFLDINEEVNSFFDRGMMGIAIDPDFATNGHVYVQYAVELNPTNPDEQDFNTAAAGQLIRISASATDPNVADPTTRVVIQDGHQMSHATHAVGDIDFDNAGNLIYTWGDGGFDPNLRLATQDPTSRQGKLFRINRETFEGIPENPFYDVSDPSSIASRVWAVGLRNSWKMSVDRATGDVYMGEVTDSGPEEINVMRADGSTVLNYGWPYYEDTNRTPYGTVPQNFVYESAFIALPHTDVGGGDAIVGGAVWRGDGAIYPEIYNGRYFFGNFNQGIVYSADSQGNYQPFGDLGAFPGVVDIQIGPDGSLWTLSLITGKLERLVYTSQGSGNTNPIAFASASSTAGPTPKLVTLDATASSDPDGDPLAFFWDFESDGIIDASGATASHAYVTVGRNTTTLVVVDDRGGTSTREVEIDVLATAPTDGNLALGRPTFQSTTESGAYASRAVDGNTSSSPADASFSQTVRTRTPLWEIDLGQVYDLSSLEIHLADGTSFPLSNFWVIVSEDPLSSGNLDAALNDPGIWAFNQVEEADPVESIAIGTLGRYLRIQMAGVDDVLALAEVRIFGSLSAT